MLPTGTCNPSPDGPLASPDLHGSHWVNTEGELEAVVGEVGSGDRSGVASMCSFTVDPDISLLLSGFLFRTLVQSFLLSSSE